VVTTAAGGDWCSGVIVDGVGGEQLTTGVVVSTEVAVAVV